MFHNLFIFQTDRYDRAGLYAGWELVFRPPITAAD